MTCKHVERYPDDYVFVKVERFPLHWAYCPICGKRARDKGLTKESDDE